jgi:nitrile hydratase beta subunit
MDGIHDLGGKQGFGRVRYTLNARVFHEPWEKRVNTLYSLAVRLGIFNMDEYRHAIERMEPRHYLSASYYERSLTSLATLCVEKGIVTQAELEQRAQGSFPLAAPSAPGRSNAAVRERFKPGDRVRVRTDYVPGHVRMPGYIRGKTGLVVSESPPYPFPDAHAHGVQAADEPSYDVRFRSEDLWHDSADPALVHAAVFQSYLERMSESS